MSRGVGWLGDVLNASKRLHKLVKTNSVRVINLMDVDVKVAADDDRTAVRRQPPEHCREIVVQRRSDRLAAGSVDCQQLEHCREIVVQRRRDRLAAGSVDCQQHEHCREIVLERRSDRLAAGSVDCQQHELTARRGGVTVQILERCDIDVERSLLKLDVVAMNER